MMVITGSAYPPGRISTTSGLVQALCFRLLKIKEQTGVFEEIVFQSSKKFSIESFSFFEG